MKVMKELKSLKDKDIEKRLIEARKELMKLRSQIASRAALKNPCRVKMVKKNIARLNTIRAERLKQRNE